MSSDTPRTTALRTQANISMARRIVELEDLLTRAHEDDHIRSLSPIPPCEPTDRDWSVSLIVEKARAALSATASPEPAKNTEGAK